MKYKLIPLFILSLFWLAFTGLDLEGQCEFTVGTINENSDYTQVLILTDSNGIIVDIINGSSGTFTTALTGSYNVHAMNYDPNDLPDPFPAIGGTIATVGTVSGCFNDNLVNDVKPLECLCDAASITASFNPQPGYSVIYVLADASGLILATNTTGIFTMADGLDDDTFIHALHYETVTPPDPLPTTGLNVDDVGTNVSGCFNTEFTSNPMCIALSPAPTDLPVIIIRVCEGNSLFASLDGVTPMVGTGLTFDWYLNGNLVASIDGSPYYSPQSTGNYTVQIYGTDCSTYTGAAPFGVTELINCLDCN